MHTQSHYSHAHLHSPTNHAVNDLASEHQQYEDATAGEEGEMF
jgi:hypothetical protein